MIIIISYIALLIGTLIYSFALVDPNITFFSHPLWTWFRNNMVQLGYYHRDTSWNIYFLIVLLLFIFHFYFIKNEKKFDPVKIALCIGLLLLFSYPFLSHDFFNYMFDAKIFTFYHQNPYLKSALDFPKDHWVRFMHWTHRAYPYGPTFILLSFIPSFLGFGKFAATFLLFKGMFIGLYIYSIYLLSKINKRHALIIATHPLIIVEGIISGHNDFIGLTLALIGIYFIFIEKNIVGRLFLLISVGIKYITLPLLFISKKNKLFKYVSLIGLIGILYYLTFYQVIQPWYFISLFALVPLFEKELFALNIFFIGLLVSYYPYIRLGGWDTAEKVSLKSSIILVFFLGNLAFVALTKIHSFLANGVLSSKGRT